eukprot:TRINITY_DN5681_c0_g1_i1.p1 TRINITY_DN5681_c0_g1~~TRINITY_DN5681_c0_g1_i1.p1  ORF type:complete len:427 (+),score=91.68 TRINITY_DN5681_c0_g1_i1:65-1345(+)
MMKFALLVVFFQFISILSVSLRENSGSSIEWAQFGRDNIHSSRIDMKLGHGTKELLAIYDVSEIVSDIVINTHSIFVGTVQGDLHCFKKPTFFSSLFWLKNLRWTTHLESIKSTPVLLDDNEHLVVATQSAIYKIAISDGSIVSTFADTGPIVSSPSVFGKDMMFGDNVQKFHRLNLEDGENSLTGDETFSCRTKGNVISSPAIDSKGTAYFTSSQSRLYAMDMGECLSSSGSKVVSDIVEQTPLCIWCDTNKFTKSFFKTDPLKSTPVLSKDEETLYVVVSLTESKKGRLVALDSENGDEKWGFEMGTSSSATPSLRENDQTIVVTDDVGLVYNLYATNGTLKWRASLDHDNSYSISAAPLQANDVIVLSSTAGSVFALNPSDGKILWDFEADGAIKSSVSADAEGVLYFGATSGGIYAIDGKAL